MNAVRFAVFVVLLPQLLAIEPAVVPHSKSVESHSISHESTKRAHVDSPRDYGRADEDTVHLLKDAKELADSTLGFWHAFVASLSVIIVSELGDKTWFIAAILAMRHPRATVFAGALCALAAMTVLSACLGWATQVIPKAVTFYVSTALFALFGLKMLKEGYDMSPNEGQEEYEEAQKEVQEKEEEYARKQLLSTGIDVEAARSSGPTTFRSLFKFVSHVFIESFTLTFLAEWGDRSQITTIILAAREDVFGVTLGGILGHGLCTGIAVIGGRLIAQRISVRTVTFVGGVVFILFALSALFISPENS